MFSMMSNTSISNKTHAPDSHQWKKLNLILPLEATTVKNPSNIKSNIGVTAGETVE